MAESTNGELLDALSVRFDAAIAHEEDVAAQDLAFSLMQDISLKEALERSRGLSWRPQDGAAQPVTEIGEDYVIAGSELTWIVPLRRIVLASSEPDEGPLVTDSNLLMELRSLARAGSQVEICAGGSLYRGRIARAGADHLLLSRDPGEMIIAPDSIEWIRAARRGSADGS